MEVQEPANPSVEMNKREALAPLPFTYQRTYNSEEAQYKKWRMPRVKAWRQGSAPYTDEEIIETIKKDREERDWFTSEYWRRKGQPEEQIEFVLDGRQITIYNWNKDRPFTDEHLTRVSRVFQEFSARFPQIMDQLRWVLVDDYQKSSAFGDPEKYPKNGEAVQKWRAFQLYPRGTELMPYRVAVATNFEGTLTHELTHLIDDEFQDEWSEKFQWAYCSDDEYRNDWEIRPTPDGTTKRPFNKKTGEMSPQGQFPLQPDNCVTFYAKQNMSEDIAESMVAYIYDPEKLKTISEDKFEILQKHDAKKPPKEVSVHRVPIDQIRLPEVKPETIPYYIKEETDNG